MPAFIEECRYEWKRLGVPDSMAEEMAAELEADLAEAQADGVSVAEMLGESDPRRFAAAWARERGLVSEPAPQKKPRRRWPWVVVGVVVFLVLSLTWLALQTLGSHSGSEAPARTTPVRGSRGPERHRSEGLQGCADRGAVGGRRLAHRGTPARLHL